MSFSNEVRKEICSGITDKDKRFACLYGMLLYCRHLSSERISFQSKSSTVSEAFAELFRRVFHVGLTCRESESSSGKTQS